MDKSQVCTLTDQDRMQDLLTQEKYLIHSYSSFIPQASCRQLKSVLISNFDGCVQNQTEIFEKMNQLGWYQTNNALKSEIDEARERYRRMKQQIAAQTGGC